MFREPSRQAVVAVRAVKTAATLAAAGSAIVVLTLGGATASPADADRISTDARCTAAAGQAIVQGHDGVVRAVPFELGWKVYRGERPGTLVVVCPS